MNSVERLAEALPCLLSLLNPRGRVVTVTKRRLEHVLGVDITSVGLVHKALELAVRKYGGWVKRGSRRRYHFPWPLQADCDAEEALQLWKRVLLSAKRRR